ncbi:MAG: DUF4160 domain-containing protein [Candidatus Eremiobacteraeota bacterium]|nr:DUF4160 domain-containing protein [Candidatus Eremiobacteraeota bacterium]
MPTIKAGRWRLVIIPGDHNPPHVHARRGTGGAAEVVFVLRAEGATAIRRRDRSLSDSDVRQAASLVVLHFKQLVTLWETFRP